MLGRFLEISLDAPEILESIDWWERLGFRQVASNDVWQHPYVVMTDGRALVGLHDYRFEHSPALTFVRQDLAHHLPSLAALDIEFEFAKTGEDQFHEAGFLSPDGQMVTLLESRTYSPPSFDECDGTVCGRLDALLLPVRRIEVSLPFWARLGMAVMEYDEDAPDTALLTTGVLTLRLAADAKLRQPTLQFFCDDLDTAARVIDERIGAPRTVGGDSLEIVSPEGLPVRISPA